MLQVKAMTLYVGGVIVVGLLAKARGRSAFGWAFLALLLTPLIAGGIVLLLRRGGGDQNPWG